MTSQRLESQLRVRLIDPLLQRRGHNAIDFTYFGQNVERLDAQAVPAHLGVVRSVQERVRQDHYPSRTTPIYPGKRGHSIGLFIGCIRHVAPHALDYLTLSSYARISIARKGGNSSQISREAMPPEHPACLALSAACILLRNPPYSTAMSTVKSR